MNSTATWAAGLSAIWIMGQTNMARIRTIKPEFWTDSKIVQLPYEARLLFIGLWNFSDDYGAIEYEADRLQLQIFPADPLVDVALLVDVLVASGLVDLMIGEEKDLLVIRNWSKHQRVDNPSKARLSIEPYRKLAIPAESRRALAVKYGCPPGGQKECACYFCGSPGVIHWFNRRDGRPGAWVCFSGLEVDHFEPEKSGGNASDNNLVLSCRPCNRSRRDKEAIQFVSQRLSKTREDYRPIAAEREGKGREGSSSHAHASEVVPATKAHRMIAMDLMDRGKTNLTPWERKFLADVCARPSLTEKMQSTLDSISAKIGIDLNAVMITWAQRLETARKMSQWDPKWGPMPGKLGCFAPDTLVIPGDGQGWTEWKAAS